MEVKVGDLVTWGSGAHKWTVLNGDGPFEISEVHPYGLISFTEELYSNKGIAGSSWHHTHFRKATPVRLTLDKFIEMLVAPLPQRTAWAYPSVSTNTATHWSISNSTNTNSTNW